MTSSRFPTTNWFADRSTKQINGIELIESLNKPAYHYAYWLTKDTALAKEVVQRAFADLLQRHKVYKQKSVAVFELIGLIKKHGIALIKLVEADGASVTAPDQSVLSQLQFLLHDLSLEEIEPLVLQVVFGLSIQEIANHLDIKQDNVASRLHTSRNRLKLRLHSEPWHTGHSEEQMLAR